LQLSDVVVSRLLAEGVFISGQTLEGFIVVDTGVPLSSLDGGAIEIVAYRLRDAAGARATYQFATTPPAAEAR
jgi:hypothetical protein